MTRKTLTIDGVEFALEPLPDSDDHVLEIQLTDEAGGDVVTQQLDIPEARDLRDMLEWAGDQGHQASGFLTEVFGDG